MQSHFAGIARVYRGVRTTDAEPVRLIGERLRGAAAVKGADIGCGDGRYDLVLFEHLPGLHLTCVDASREMLDQADAYLEASGVTAYEVVQSSIAGLDLPARAFDCVFTFNAIHHFDFPTFLARAGAALKDAGHVFIYTRLPAQNARTIWGRCFPGFAERETRLYELDQMRRWIRQSEGLGLDTVDTCRFARRVSLERLLDQARSKHYSTLSLYAKGEFEAALVAFEDNLRRRFDDLERIEWQDENVLLHLRRQEP
jgi:SAM-dependent methyltransferase